MNPESNQTKPNYLLIVTIIFVLIVIAGYMASNNNSSSEATLKQTSESSETMPEEQDTPTETTTDTLTPINETAVADEPPLQSVGEYKIYNANEVANDNSATIVLFFHATWCPSCHALDNNLNNNLSHIPAGTTIYKVDYDTFTELKKKYGVTTQHTLVQIQADGTLLKKWSGGNTLDSLVLETI